MSLASIVSGVVKKENKVDRKKVAYFFRDYIPSAQKRYQIELLMLLLKPEEVTILSVQNEFIGDEDNNVLTSRIVDNLSVLLPNTKVTVVYGSMVGNGSDIVLDEDAPLTKEQLAMSEVGLCITSTGELYVYKGQYVPAGAQFYSNALSQENLEALRDDDLDVLFPTANMYMLSDLVRNREPHIMICYFLENSKKDIIGKIGDITKSILGLSIKATFETTYFDEDFKKWEHHEGESITLFDQQYDYVLVLRDNRVDIYLNYENGSMSKEPNGWLLLN